jgi:NAD(P)-dependent dehydrogenase (short-subunit alcohol dehydrogenase family)
VTGAARGLGAAIARALANEACAVAAGDIDATEARDIAAELGERAIGVDIDVRDRESVAAAVAGVVEQLGEITVLVNCAGINHVGRSETLDEALWSDVLEINLSGAFRCCQIVGARMLTAGRGSIINLASVQARRASPGRAAYCASKSGLVGLTQALAVEWAARGVRVNAISPGYMKTRLALDAIQSGLISESELLDRIPVRRLGEPEDVARAAVFLASPEANYITGTTIEVDGGYAAFGAPGPASRLPSESAPR